MKLSHMYQRIPLNNNDYCIFNNLILKMAVLTSEEINQLETFSLDKDKSDMMQEIGVYIDDDKNENDRIHILQNQAEMGSGPITCVYLFVTENCNLACEYCEIKNNKTHITRMTKEIFNKFWSEFIKYSRNVDHDITIILFGGEPLMEKELITYILTHIKNEANVKPAIITNGTLMTESFLDVLVMNNVAIGISLDGPPQITDANRKFAGSIDSVYERCISAVQSLKKRNIEVNLSITITDELINMEEQFFQWIMQVAPNNISYNLVKHCAHYDGNKKEIIQYYQKVTKFILRSNEVLAVRGIRDDRIQRILIPFFKRTFYVADCTAVSANQLTIRPNGNVLLCHACSAPNNILGNILKDDLEDIIKNEKRFRWSQYLPIKRKQCLKCECVLICGGGCYAQAEYFFGSEEFMDDAFCTYMKSMFNNLVIRLCDMIEKD